MGRPRRGCISFAGDGSGRRTRGVSRGGQNGLVSTDGESVARDLADAAERDGRVTDATAAIRDRGFSVSFTVASASELEGHAVAHEVLRDAWAVLEIEAVPGDDFDVSSITLRAI